ncbi:phage T7 F exclusion suppressor FxsA [compost metagenome]
MLDGLCVFFGGLLLIIPGFITDIIGFTLVFPLTRTIYRGLLLKWLEKRMKNGTFTFYRR